MLLDKEQPIIVISNCPISKPIAVRKYKPSSSSKLKSFSKTPINKIEQSCDFDKLSIEEIENDFNLFKAKSENFSSQNEILAILNKPKREISSRSPHKEIQRVRRPIF